MRLKSLYYLIIIISFLSCQNQTNKHIDKFENILGKTNTDALNLLVSDFEDNLEKVYPDLSLQKAYEQYLKDLINPKETNWKKFKFQTKKTHSEFIKSGLKDEIYFTSREYVPEKNDTLFILHFNRFGKYMEALYAIKESDSLIFEYWDKKEAAGNMQDELVVDGILNSKPNFDNYFHKRIVIIEYSY